MIYLCQSKDEAQALADRLHAHAIDANPLYAQSVKEGHTLRWAEVREDVDEKGNGLGTWSIPLDDRVVGGLAEKERARVLELKELDEKPTLLDSPALGLLEHVVLEGQPASRDR